MLVFSLPLYSKCLTQTLKYNISHNNMYFFIGNLAHRYLFGTKDKMSHGIPIMTVVHSFNIKI